MQSMFHYDAATCSAERVGPTLFPQAWLVLKASMAVQSLGFVDISSNGGIHEVEASATTSIL